MDDMVAATGQAAEELVPLTDFSPAIIITSVPRVTGLWRTHGGGALTLAPAAAFYILYRIRLSR